jgi:hypothetical protein
VVKRFAARFALPALLATVVVAACTAPEQPADKYRLIDMPPGQVYGPVLASPISIRLGQSVLTAHGPVGPSDRPQGPPAIWEGHALSLDPDRDRSRTLYFYVEAESLKQVSLQVNDQPAIIETNPGAYLSGEFTMVRWAQDYSLKVTAENMDGITSTAAIHVNGEDAHVEVAQAEPLRMRMLRLGDSTPREVRGVGFRGKLHRHAWPECTSECDLTTPGGALVAMISGPADTLLLLMDEDPYIAWGLSYWPSPNYMIVAIPVRGESQVEIAALSRDGDLARGRWDRPEELTTASAGDPEFS